MGQPLFEKLVPPEGESFRCFDRATIDAPSRWHRHPEIELTYVERGSGTRLVGDSIDSYRDHDLVLIGPNLPHTWQSDEYFGHKYDRHSAIVVQFAPDFMGTGFFELPELRLIGKMLTQANQGIWFAPEVAIDIGRLMASMVSSTPAVRLIHLLEALHQLSLAGPTRTLSSPSYAPAFMAANETRAEKVCHYIACNYRNPELSQDELAKFACMNASAFSRFFKQSTGKSFTDYVTELRIGLACRLLIDSDMSMLQISGEAGFANISSFNRQFKSYRQMTPREYRQRHSSLRDNDLSSRRINVTKLRNES